MPKYAVKDGQMIIDDNGVLVKAPFGRTIAQITRTDIVQVTTDAGAVFGSVTFYTVQGPAYTAEMLPSRKVGEIQALFPVQPAPPMAYQQPMPPLQGGVPQQVVFVQQAPPQRTEMKVVTYKNAKAMERGIRQEAKQGWIVQTNTGHSEKGFSAGKAIAGGLILGPVGLLAGGIGKKKAQFTVTFTRQV